MTDERLTEIRAAVYRAERRMDSERCFQLLSSCRELLAEVARLQALVPVQLRLESHYPKGSSGDSAGGSG